MVNNRQIDETRLLTLERQFDSQWLMNRQIDRQIDETRMLTLDRQFGSQWLMNRQIDRWIKQEG